MTLEEELLLSLGPEGKAIEFWRVPNTTMTVCAITLQNGFTVIGSEACVNPEIFDEFLGKQYAFQNAVNHLGPFMGWRECDRRSAINH